MAGPVRTSCRCGAVQVALAVPGPGAGTRVTCYCRNCQTAAGLFGHAGDLLSPGGGSEIWQTTPDRITIEAGAEHLEILRLSPKGLYRWHARCCDTPVFNTLPNVRLPFVGVVLRQSELHGDAAALGPSRCRAHTKHARPGPDSPVRDHGFTGAALKVLRRMAGAWFGGRAKANPLLDPEGGPIAPVTVIPLETRRAAIPEHLR